MANGAPQFSLMLAGQRVDELTLRTVISIDVRESLDEIDAVTIRLAVPETAPELTKLLQLGAPFSIALGYGAETLKQVTGDVVELQYRVGARDVRVATLRGLDALHRLKQKRLTRYWNLPHSAIAQTIAGEHGLRPVVQAAGGLASHEFQQNETNAGFLTRLARRNNFVLSGGEGALIFMPRRAPIRYTIPQGESLIDLDLRQCLSDLPTRVIVRGWDYRLNQPVVGTSQASLLKRYSGGSTGVELAQKLHGATTLELDNTELSTPSACTAFAQATHQQLAELFVQGQAIIAGRPEILSGGLISFSGVGAQSGAYLVVASTHTLEPGSGYRTLLHLRSDSLPKGGAA